MLAKRIHRRNQTVIKLLSHSHFGWCACSLGRGGQAVAGRGETQRLRTCEYFFKSFFSLKVKKKKEKDTHVCRLSGDVIRRW